MLDHNTSMEQVRFERARAHKLQQRVDELVRENQRLREQMQAYKTRLAAMKEKYA